MASTTSDTCSMCGSDNHHSIAVRDDIETTHVCGLCAIQLLTHAGLTIVLEIPLAVTA